MPELLHGDHEAGWPAERGAKVRVAPEEVARFNARWPGSTLRPERSYWFEFDRFGDLVDTDCPEHDDGPAQRRHKLARSGERLMRLAYDLEELASRLRRAVLALR